MSKPCNEVLDLFKEKYLTKVGDRYLPTYGRDLKMFTSLLREHSVQQLSNYMDIYFKTVQRFYSPVFFKANINQYAVEWRRQNPIKTVFKNLESDRFI